MDKLGHHLKFTSANFALLNRLDAGTEYKVRVRAESAVEAGMWSIVEMSKTYMSEMFGLPGTLSMTLYSCRSMLNLLCTLELLPILIKAL